MFNSKKYLKNYSKKYPERIKKYAKKAKRIYLDKRKELIKELKINGCAICGYNRCQHSLDFHHSNPEDKLFRIGLSNIGHNYTIEKIIDEVNKCILVCANCHREIENGGI